MMTWMTDNIHKYVKCMVPLGLEPRAFCTSALCTADVLGRTDNRQTMQPVCQAAENEEESSLSSTRSLHPNQQQTGFLPCWSVKLTLVDNRSVD